MTVYVYLLVTAVMAALVPLALIATRNELRTVRSRIVEELRSTLFKDHPDLPQLQLVAARYRDGPDAIGGDREAREPESQKARQGRVKLWTGMAFYFLVCVTGFVILFMPRQLLLSEQASGPGLSPALFWMVEPTGVDLLAQAVTIAGAAFLGGYVFQLRYLIRATLNQELGALAFVRASLHIVQGLVVAVVAYRALGAGVADLEPDNTRWFGSALGIAFLVGYWPDLGLMKIAKGLRVRTKLMDDEAMKIAKIVPLEVIEGIDTETSFRLQESNLYDVQNLASANPIELFAETPYTLLEIFDWVLQAQLCANVGVGAFGELKRHGIRTIFDLERAVLAKGAPPDYVSAVGCILFKHADPKLRARFCTPPDESGAGGKTVDPEVVRHAVAVMADDLHIHRLRSLWRTMLKTTAEGPEPAWLYHTDPLPGDDDYPPRVAS